MRGHRIAALAGPRAGRPAANVGPVTVPAPLLHFDLHPENVVLTAAGPVVVDWANATEGPPGLDTAMTAIILAEVATDRSAPMSMPASELLVGYLAATGPARLLDRAAMVRAEVGPLGADRLAEAAALVRQLAPR